MHILYLSRWLPYPASNGIKLRIYNLLKRLAQSGHQIELITFYEQGENSHLAVEHLRQFCHSIECVAYKPFQPGGWKARTAFLALRPRSVIATFQPVVAQKVEQSLAQGMVELLIASEIDMAGYGLKARHYGVPAILEELEVGLLYKQFKEAKTLKERGRNGLTWLKLRAYLAKLARYYQAITVVSEQEKSILQPLVGQTSLCLLPNGADLESYHFKPYRPEQRKFQLIFNGSLTFALNFEAVSYFLSEIFPLIKQATPELKLLVTGRHDGVDLQSLTHNNARLLEGVEFTGFVDELSPLIQESKICVAPLLRGGGTRLKILEAFALGTPVVATSKGAEGLDAQDGEQLLIADTPQEFAGAISRVLTEPELAVYLAQNARKLVEAKYDWDTIAQSFDALIRRVIQTPS